MSSAPREAKVPLTRWQYFVKTLYHDPAKRTTFSYNKVIYAKSDELMDIEFANSRINTALLLLLILMFVAVAKYQSAWFMLGGMLLIVAGEVYRMLRLPRDIKAHLTDTGRRER